MTNTQKIRRLYDLAEGTHFGFSQTVIESLEARLGTILPAVLRDYYLTLGKNEHLNHSHNQLLEPATEVCFSKDRYLIFYEENQGVAVWGIKEADLNLANPPVWGNWGTAENPEWQEEANTTNDFLLLMATYNGTLGGLKYNANYFGPVAPAVVELVKRNRTEETPLSWNKQKIYTHEFGDVISLTFEEENPCSGILIGTSSRERFQNMLETILVDWDYTSLEDEEE